jgi:hypothetical protein
MPICRLSGCQSFDDAFQSADSRMKLPHDVDDPHDGRCSEKIRHYIKRKVALLVAPIARELWQRSEIRVAPSNRRTYHDNAGIDLTPNFGVNVLKSWIPLNGGTHCRMMQKKLNT